MGSLHWCEGARSGTWPERQADAAALLVASTALPSLMQSFVRVTAAATASALTRAACSRRAKFGIQKDLHYFKHHSYRQRVSP